MKPALSWYQNYTNYCNKRKLQTSISQEHQQGEIECGRVWAGERGESNGGKLGTTVIEQQQKIHKKRTYIQNSKWNSNKLNPTIHEKDIYYHQIVLIPEIKDWFNIQRTHSLTICGSKIYLCILGTIFELFYCFVNIVSIIFAFNSFEFIIWINIWEDTQFLITHS